MQSIIKNSNSYKIPFGLILVFIFMLKVISMYFYVLLYIILCNYINKPINMLWKPVNTYKNQKKTIKNAATNIDINLNINVNKANGQRRWGEVEAK